MAIWRTTFGSLPHFAHATHYIGCMHMHDIFVTIAFAAIVLAPAWAALSVIKEGREEL